MRRASEGRGSPLATAARRVLTVLDDGTYDAIVFDAHQDDVDRDDTGDGATTVELTILAGDHKGEVVSLRTGDWRGDVVGLLGVPATITVTGGEPSVRFEP